MRFELCDIDNKNLTACWAIDGGRIFIHFTHSLSELIALRKHVDEMIEDLEKVKIKKDKEHKQSLRAKRARKRSRNV